MASNETQARKASPKRLSNSSESSTPSFEFERRLGFPKIPVAGVDEVGRGCIAGPVVAAAVIIPAAQIDSSELLEVNDSKLVEPGKRIELARWIQRKLIVGVGWAEVEEIDEINIFQASLLAMYRAVQKLPQSGWKHLLVDGKFVPKPYSKRGQAIVKGDQRSITIACASIVAKVYRDEWMVRFDSEFPGYELGLHKGYPTPAHKKILRQKGVTRLHRRSFAPVREILFPDAVQLEIPGV